MLLYPSLTMQHLVGPYTVPAGFSNTHPLWTSLDSINRRSLR